MAEKTGKPEIKKAGTPARKRSVAAKKTPVAAKKTPAAASRAKTDAGKTAVSKKPATAAKPAAKASPARAKPAAKATPAKPKPVAKAAPKKTKPKAPPAKAREIKPATPKRPGRLRKPAKKTPKMPKTNTAAADEPKLEISASRQFGNWLAESRVSLGFTTYQTGKVFLIGMRENGGLSVFERTFNRCMGLCVHEDQIYMSSIYQLWRFQNVLAEGQQHEGYDRVYVPINGHTTGDLDIHDIAVDSDGRVIFVNTLFGCLAVLDDKASFAPIWKPPFLSKLAAEDRCHMNGLAMENGKPKYVTAVAETDVPDGWREKRTDGGVVIDVETNEILTRGLSMPHSPRIYRDKLYVLNSGAGEFGTIDRTTGEYTAIAFCPGYLRGMSFHGFYAIVGLSKPRENKTFTGVPLDQALVDKNAEAQCALYVIDLRTGDIVHWLRMEGIVQELYDVVFLEGAVRPMALGFKTEEIRRTITVGQSVDM